MTLGATSASSGPLLAFENVGKDYFGNTVLSDVSFSLDAGQILGIVGENGAGKSTMMNILFGMPVIASTGGYTGRVVFEGSEARFRSPFDAIAAGIGMVHQEFSLLPGFTVTENILLNRESTRYSPLVEAFGDRVRSLDRGDMARRAQSAVDRLAVSLSIDDVVSDMPVGHKQFTEIAREISRDNTKLIVMDEPTATLAEAEAEILVDALRGLAKSGIAIIFISHRLLEVIDLCDKIAVLRDGCVAAEMPASEADVTKLASLMVGRSISHDTSSSSRDRSGGDDALVIKDLWADMQGERVKSVSLTVKRGEIFGIGGLAGQGKLGVANGIMGVCEAGGEVAFEGRAVPLNDPAGAISMGLAFVSEDRRGAGLLLDESIEWNIAFTAMQSKDRFIKPLLGGLVKLRDEAAMKEAAEGFIKSLEIRCTGPKQRAVELSGGNQQKVCLAKAFATDPKLLFVSEPTRGIDIGAKKLVLDTLKSVNKERGATIVVTSSELEELRSVCDRIAIIREGRVAGILPASAPAQEFGALMMGIDGARDGGER